MTRYIQAVHAVITGLLPSITHQQEPALLLRLACLQLRAKFAANGSGDVAGPAYARALGNRIVEFIPALAFKERKAGALWTLYLHGICQKENPFSPFFVDSLAHPNKQNKLTTQYTTAGWREGMAVLLETDPSLRSLSEPEAQRAYLALVEPLPLFGAVLTVRGAVADPGTAQARVVTLVVDGEGLAVYPDDEPSATALEPSSRVALEEIAQWGFLPQGQGLFYYTRKPSGLRVEGEGAGAECETVVVNYGTAKGSAVCEALTCMAYAYLKDAELAQREKNGAGAGAGPIIAAEEEEGEEGEVGGKGV